MLIKIVGQLRKGKKSMAAPLRCKRCGKSLHKQKHEVCAGCLKRAGSAQLVKGWRS